MYVVVPPRIQTVHRIATTRSGRRASLSQSSDPGPQARKCLVREVQVFTFDGGVNSQANCREYTGRGAGRDVCSGQVHREESRNESLARDCPGRFVGCRVHRDRKVLGPDVRRRHARRRGCHREHERRERTRQHRRRQPDHPLVRQRRRTVARARPRGRAHHRLRHGGDLQRQHPAERLRYPGLQRRRHLDHRLVRLQQRDDDGPRDVQLHRCGRPLGPLSRPWQQRERVEQRQRAPGLRGGGLLCRGHARWRRGHRQHERR